MTEVRRLSAADASRVMLASQSTRGPANAEVLDMQGLCDRCMGNLALVERVLNKFEQRLPEELAELERELELGDAAKVALAAHRIKGNSSNVSAAGLQQAAEEIEDLGRAGRMADIPPHLSHLHDEWRQYVACRPSFRLSANEIAGHGPAPAGPAAIVSEAHS